MKLNSEERLNFFVALGWSSPRAIVLNQGLFCFAGDMWASLGTFFVVTTQSGASLLASGRQGPGRPLQGAH